MITHGQPFQLGMNFTILARTHQCGRVDVFVIEPDFYEISSRNKRFPVSFDTGCSFYQLHNAHYVVILFSYNSSGRRSICRCCSFPVRTV